MNIIVPHEPRLVPQVMVSSTYTDLKEHRAALIEAIHKHKLHAIVMEHDDAKVNGDVIDSSLQMVRDSAAYILLISLKYGQVPICPKRNPDNLSITELEFNEAQRLGRATLLFVMHDDHPTKKGDIERDHQKEEKLNAFRQRAKLASPGGQVNRVYAVFNNLLEFKDRFATPLADLRDILQAIDKPAAASAPPVSKPHPDTIPRAPEFYAEPDYIGSHKFIGRDAQLQELNDWAEPADPTNLLLFEAIGGNGKSMLTWEWVTNSKHALAARPASAPWAGRFWYSFYERGAIMADFCQRAMAYMTGKPLSEFAKKKTAALEKDLLALMHARPWLFVLDGLERVLVHYHHNDAADMLDEEANAPTDKIVNRDPCDAIREEDNHLLRALAGAKPSKILVSSRLTPRVLLNAAGQTISGARRINLPGLRPADAEALLRSCEVTGNSTAIRAYLTENCDNHPLVIGVLGGLINKPGMKRGNFDAWVTDPDGGAKLNLANLDLVQRRNHILRAALDALPSASRQLLSTLALISESVDYETLSAFNPHLPPEPEEMEEPTQPEAYRQWNMLTDEKKAERRVQYSTDLELWKHYKEAVQARFASTDYHAAPKKLAETVSDLEKRGLLQYDGRERRYDLHPVVRGVASGDMKAEDKERYGGRVIDYFSSLPHNPYEEAETLQDVSPVLHVVRTLLKLGRYQEAVDSYGDLADAFFANLEEYSGQLALLKPFFPVSWSNLPQCVERRDAYILMNNIAACLHYCGESDEALAAFVIALRGDLEAEDSTSMAVRLRNISRILVDQGRLAAALRINILSRDLAALLDDRAGLFLCKLFLFTDHVRLGQSAEAETAWKLLGPMGQDWSRQTYRPGGVEQRYAEFQFYQGTLEETHLSAAEQLAVQGKSRMVIRQLHRLRGVWRLEQGEWALAATSFAEATRMAREKGILDAESETGLALAGHHLRQLAEPQFEIERLSKVRRPSHRYLSMLWQAVGNLDQAKHHALAAYKWAWADGEPYVRRFELTKTTELLRHLAIPIPNLPSFDSAKTNTFPWEDDVRAVIDRLRAEKHEKLKNEDPENGP